MASPSLVRGLYKKMLLLSQLAVFKDIVPGYKIRALSEEEQKLKEKVLAHEKEKAKAKAAAAITWAEALDVSGKFLVCECDVEGDVSSEEGQDSVVLYLLPLIFPCSSASICA